MSSAGTAFRSLKVECVNRFLALAKKAPTFLFDVVDPGLLDNKSSRLRRPPPPPPLPPSPALPLPPFAVISKVLFEPNFWGMVVVVGETALLGTEDRRELDPLPFWPLELGRVIGTLRYEAAPALPWELLIVPLLNEFHCELLFPL